MPGPATDFVMPTKYASFGPVPNGAPVLVTALEVAFLTGYFSNPTAGTLVLTITDGSNQPIVPGQDIPPNGTWHLPSELSRFTGLKWGMDLAGGYGELLGYPTT